MSVIDNHCNLRIFRCFLAGICPHDSHSFVESIPPPGDYLDHVTGILGVLERFVEPGSIIAASRVKGVRTKEYRDGCTANAWREVLQ